VRPCGEKIITEDEFLKKDLKDVIKTSQQLTELYVKYNEISKILDNEDLPIEQAVDNIYDLSDVFIEIIKTHNFLMTRAAIFETEDKSRKDIQDEHVVMRTNVINQYFLVIKPYKSCLIAKKCIDNLRHNFPNMTFNIDENDSTEHLTTQVEDSESVSESVSESDDEQSPSE